MFNIRRLAVLCFTLLLSLGSLSVWASWEYFFPAETATGSLALGLTGFYYKTEEVLPDDSANDENALGFVQYVIYNTKAGLNSSKGNEIFRQLKNTSNKQLHSKDKITNTNLDHIFKDTNSGELEFTMEYVSDTQIRLYVYMDSDLETAEQRLEESYNANQPITVRITTFVTIIERSASEKLDWDDKGSAKGNAVVVNDGSFYVIDPSTWSGLEATKTEEGQA